VYVCVYVCVCVCVCVCVTKLFSYWSDNKTGKCVAYSIMWFMKLLMGTLAVYQACFLSIYKMRLKVDNTPILYKHENGCA